jgi:tRNA uridine 5-carboxymethylaminomethyl modification enzyme
MIPTVWRQENIMINMNRFDIAVIGAGHAGCEAGLAAARLGAKTLIFSINLDAVANMPCNPSIGGTGKGHLVREIDALGGEMGKITDKTFIQSRVLNKGKGPAVYSLRAQADRRTYQTEMKKCIENQENLFLKQGEIINIVLKDGAVKGIYDSLNTYYEVKAVIIATGTFLDGKIFLGEYTRGGGPDGMFQAVGLSDCLRVHGVKLMRFKTGTPARIHRDSIDFSKMEVQYGDDEILPFSFDTVDELKNKAACHLTYSTEKTKKVILENIHRSPLYGGLIEGTGPRYCPSFEDKIMRFPDKERHQVFIEPMGLDTKEMYVQGMSSSLPYDVQLQMYRSVIGLENAEIMRPAYAIEYDCADPTELTLGLQFKKIKGLYGAGQFNGTSGYEEAAAQGLIAGINAARYVKNQDEIRLTRDSSYIGVLIDDLTTKGTREPYRIMTSRSEYRLLLRQDNADARLTPLGHEIGLISKERYSRFLMKYEAVGAEIELLRGKILPPSARVSEIFEKYNSTDIKTGIRLTELLKRPEMSYEILRELCPDLKELYREIRDAVSIAVKYEGYIKRQRAQVNQFKKLENKLLPTGIDYEKIYGLRIEARQKLKAAMPESIGQASRLSGVSPADIAVLLIYLETY